jgi:hypothetical protein
MAALQQKQRQQQQQQALGLLPRHSTATTINSLAQDTAQQLGSASRGLRCAAGSQGGCTAACLQELLRNVCGRSCRPETRRACTGP